MRIHPNISVSEAKLKELQKAKKADVFKWLKETGQFNGISKKAAETQMNKVYDTIKSWGTEKKVGKGNPSKDNGDD